MPDSTSATMTPTRLDTLLQCLDLQSLSDSRCEGMTTRPDQTDLIRCAAFVPRNRIEMAMRLVSDLSSITLSASTKETILHELSSHVLCFQHRTSEIQRQTLKRRWMQQLDTIEGVGYVQEAIRDQRMECLTLHTSTSSMEMYSLDRVANAVLLGALESQDLLEDDNYTGFVNHVVRSIRRHPTSLIESPRIQTLGHTPHVAQVLPRDDPRSAEEFNPSPDSNNAEQASNQIVTTTRGSDHQAPIITTSDNTRERCVFCFDALDLTLSSDNNSLPGQNDDNEPETPPYLTQCRQCQKQFHGECMDEYLVHQYSQEMVTRCPLCRLTWHDQITDDSSEYSPYSPLPALPPTPVTIRDFREDYGDGGRGEDEVEDNARIELTEVEAEPYFPVDDVDSDLSLENVLSFGASHDRD